MLRVIALLVVLLRLGAASAGTVPMPDADHAVPVGRYAEVLQDPDGKLQLADVRSPDVAARFSPVGQDAPNFGYTYATHWLRFNLPAERGPQLAPLLVLEVRFPSLDHLELHVPYATANGVEYRVQRTGDQVPWATREVKHRNHVFRIPTTGLADAPVYLRVQTQSVLTVPAYLWRPEALIAHDRNTQMGYGLFYGLIAALFLYNLMVYLALRDTTYLWYVLYVGAFGVGLAAFDGFAFQYLWPGSVWWANHALGTALCSTLLFGALFARGFLELPAITVFANRFLLAVAALAGFGALCAATGWVPYGSIMRALSATACAAAGVVLYVAVRARMRGYRPAGFFLLAWAALLVFIALGALRNFALVPTNFLTVNGLHIGLSLDVILLSFALADRIAAITRDKEAAQAAALASNNALLAATLAAERELEERIAQRTAELNRANERLREEAGERELLLRQLRDQEQQLRHMAQHDVLTGLPNRASLQQRLALAMEFARRNRKKLAVMMVDLDGFKRLNDSRGHLAGDAALAQIAGRLRTSVRASDTVARYGGDEFVVLASELDRAEDVETIAEKIADLAGMPVAVEGQMERLGCSIGISVFPDDATDALGLIACADRAMYAAKQRRDRRFTFYAT